MSDKLVDKVADAVLYEGYLLYPYRPSVKNRQRWTFGGLHPKAYHDAHGGYDAWTMQTQCLVQSDKPPGFNLRLRFLHLIDRTVGQLHHPLENWPTQDGAEPPYQPVDMLQVADQRYQPWQEAAPREVPLHHPGGSTMQRKNFTLPGSRDLEPIRNHADQIVGLLIRQHQPLQGTLELSTQRLGPNLHRITARIQNDTPLDHARSVSRDDALMRSLVSTHMVLELDPHTEGEPADFVSLIDPPPQYQHGARACDNQGCWPVLVGEEGQTDTMLGSPIILYDYPQIADQSPGDLFDGTEIDEILSLRIMTLTDEEKREAAANDDHAKALVQRTESLAREELMNLHGQMRPVGAQNTKSENRNAKPISNSKFETPRHDEACVRVEGAELAVGDRVRLNPRGNADVFDVVLKGLTATIEKIERDLENRVHLAVTIDEDPGADFGREGKPGHRFFFEPRDVEPLTTETKI